MAMKKIGKYQIVGKIGAGGMGAVYKAKHPTLKRLVILKQLTLRGKSSLIERFKREARIMLDLRNDNIVQVYDHFKEGNYYYIAMEYVDGIALDRLIHKRRYLSNEAAILIFTEVCKGLKYAHDRHIIHRDIKPANVLISKDGVVKLTDFGIATSKEDETFGLTRAGTTLGTPAYMPPEQIVNSKNVDRRADIYAMGVMLYNMLTGKLPYPTNMSPHTIARIEKGSFIAPREINPKISPKIQKIIKKCMKPKRHKRYKDLSVVLSKFRMNLAKYKNSVTINHTIMNYIKGKEIKVKKIKLKGINIFALLPVNRKGFLWVLLLLFLGSIVLYKFGIIQEYLLRNKYGAMRVVIESRNEVSLKRKDIDSSVYYRNEKGKYIKLRWKYIIFKKNQKRSNKQTSVFESQKIYLRSNQYYLDTSIRNEKYYSNFFVNSRAKQVKFVNTRDAKKVEINYNTLSSSLLRINFDFQEIDSNKSINGVNVQFWYNSGWVDWYSFYKRNYSLIRSGKTYYFLFSRSGYLRNKYEIDVDSNQTELNLKVEMTPNPGTLRININNNNLKLYLNNSKYYLNGGLNSEYLRIQPSIFDYILYKMLYYTTNKKGKKYNELKNSFSNNKRLILQPGKYTVKVKKFSLFSKIYDSKAINIIPNGMVTLNIKYDKKNKNLKIY